MLAEEVEGLKKREVKDDQEIEEDERLKLVVEVVKIHLPLGHY